ncbi:MAG: OmpA family protein [Candidatus Gastranaerophilales bacterium]|nr:OmpA family protein [Candidatus Gastranaerophilales bacterium]
MGAKFRPKKQEFEENIFWVTMSDLFIGMFMIFATLFFAFCANTGQGAGAEAAQATREAVQQVVEKMREQNINVVEKAEQVNQIVEEKPVETAKKIDVEIDPFSGMAKISDLELFKLNSAELTPAGKQFLTKFLPVYFDAILNSELKKYVTYIVIQGHTDSNLFRGSYTPQQQYMKNMNLSMNRAYNVAEFIFQICKGKPYYKDLTHIIRVEGASFSKPIMVNGKEDFKQSRRVELRLTLKEQKLDVLQQFLKQGTGGQYEKL